jgi:hypothetical protein
MRLPKIALFTIAFVAFAVTWFFNIQLPGRTPGGPLEFAADVIDLGEVPIATEVAGSLLVTNIAPFVYELPALRSTCGCTEAAFSAEKLRSGQTAHLYVNYRSPHLPGVYREDVIVADVDSPDSIKTIGVIARVVAPIWADPPNLKLNAGEEANIKIQTNAEFEIVNMTTSGSSNQLGISTVSAGQDWVMIRVAADDATHGNADINIDFRDTSGKMDRLSIPLVWFTEAEFSVVPDHLVLNPGGSESRPAICFVTLRDAESKGKLVCSSLHECLSISGVRWTSPTTARIETSISTEIEFHENFCLAIRLNTTLFHIGLNCSTRIPVDTVRHEP